MALYVCSCFPRLCNRMGKKQALLASCQKTYELKNEFT